MLGQNLRQLWESLGPVECRQLLSEGLASGEFRPEDFSLKEMAVAFCGYQWYERLNPRTTARYGQLSVMEAGEGVDVSAFSDIVGQIFFNKIMEGWKLATLVGERLTQRVPTNLDGERMPWVGNIVGEGENIRPGETYPETSFGERFIDTPSTNKQGQILSLTKEVIYFDRTGMVLPQARKVGYRLGFNKERQILSLVLGLTNSYKLNGTTYNTYLTAPQSVPAYANSQSATPLVDYTSIEQAYILSTQVLDPDTSEPIEDLQLKQLFVMPNKLITARRIVGATELRSTYPGYTSTVNPPAPGNVQMIGDGQAAMPWNLEVLTSPIAYQLLLNSGLTAAQASNYWYAGDFQEAFAWMENWPFEVVQAPANSVKEFENDIVVRWKASHRGVAAVLEPRRVFKLTNT